MPKTVHANNFTGGLVTLDEQSIKDDQLPVLKNFFYNANKRPQTRRGYKKFGNAVPDTVVEINQLNATTDITASLDATTLATGTAIKGSNSVSFNIDVSNDAADQALVTWAGASSVDISTAKGSVRFYIYVPTGFNTDLTDVKFQLGSDASNYYEWTLGTLTEDSNNFIVLDYSDATTTGTPVDTAIDHFVVDVTYTSSYTDKTGILIDWLYSYSGTSTKPVTSWMFHRTDDASQERTALCVAGDNMFEYDETTTDWLVIDTGLTEFETKTGFTTHRTRWDYDVYKNVFYMCNGVDDYRSYDGTAITTYPAEPKVRYLKMETNRMFGAGDDENPSTVYYTADAPANASDINANAVVIGGDQIGKINGLHSLGQIILAFKDKKIYSIDIATPSALPIDARAGGFSDRSIANVGNSLLYFTDGGVETLKQRSAVTGSQALESKSLTEDLKTLLDKVEPNQYNANVGWYIKPLTNYYFVYDSNDDNIPDSWLVYSSLVGAWSEYTLPAAYDMGEYIKSDGDYQYVFTSANGGQVYELETGFDDNGIAIEFDIRTKEWNFDGPFTEKDFQFMDISGLSSTGQDIDVSVIIDDEEASSASIDNTFIDQSASPFTISSSPISTETIGGGGETTDGLDTFPYKMRVPIPFTRGSKIQLGLSSRENKSLQFTLDRIAITYEANTFDVFPIDNIA